MKQRWPSPERLAALAWLGLLLAAAVLAPWLPLPFLPDTTDLSAIVEAPFRSAHWLGTDPLGRDVLAGLVFGARTVLLISVPAAALATLLGALLGSTAGFWGNTGLRVPAVGGAALAGTLLAGLLVQAPPGQFLFLITGVAALLTGGAYGLWRSGVRRQLTLPLDRMLLAGVALLATIPLLILALTLAALYPPSVAGLLLVLTLTYWPGPARLVRAEVMRVRALPFMEAGRALGLPGRRLLWHHALPNCWHTLRTTFPLSVATLIGLETTLSFLGVGLPPETASWGRMLASARLAPTAWWLIAVPALAILCTTLALRQLAAPKPGRRQI